MFRGNNWLICVICTFANDQFIYHFDGESYLINYEKQMEEETVYDDAS